MSPKGKKFTPEADEKTAVEQEKGIPEDTESAGDTPDAESTEVGPFDDSGTESFPESAQDETPSEKGNFPKSLMNTDGNGAKKNVKDIEFFGDPDAFQLLSKASSKSEGWMKSTKAMSIPGAGCIVQVTTQQRNQDGSYAIAEAITFVPNVMIEEKSPAERGDDPHGEIQRKIVRC